MYEQLFETKLATLLVMLAASTLVGAAVSRASIGLRSIAYNFVPSIALAFYVVAPFGNVAPDRPDLAAGLLFELVALAVFVRLFGDVYRITHGLSAEDVRRALWWSLPLQLILGAPQLSLDNFGIFADGSRIGYLGEAAWAKYLTYAIVVLTAIQAPLLARWVTLRGSLGMLGWAVVLLNAANSTLSGSKGAVFLWLIAVGALVDWRRVRVRWGAIISFGVVALAGLVGSVLFLSDVMSIEPGEFVDLAFSRFMITNDARALTFDLRADTGSPQAMLRESLRSLSGVLGLAPRQDPLGILLYDVLFGPGSGNGANGSLMALITFYMPRGAALLPAMLAAAALLVLATASRYAASLTGDGLGGLFVSAAALVCLQLYSQDFLAFQLAAPMAVLITVASLAQRWRRRRKRPALAVSA